MRQATTSPTSTLPDIPAKWRSSAKTRETSPATTLPAAALRWMRLQSVRDELLNLQIQQQTSLQSSADAQSSSSSTNSNLLHHHGQRHRQRADRVFKQPGGIVRDSHQRIRSTGRDRQRARILRAPSTPPPMRSPARNRRPTAGSANGCSDQLAHPTDRAVQRAACAGSGRRKWRHDRGSARPVGAATLRPDGHLSHAEQRRRDHHHRQRIAAGDGLAELQSADRDRQRRLAASAGFERQQHYGCDSGRYSRRSYPGSRPDHSRLPDAVEYAGQPVCHCLQRRPGTRAPTRTATQGAAFFTVPANPGDAGAAAGISVAITNPSQIAISSDGSAGSNGNVANLSAALTNASAVGPIALPMLMPAWSFRWAMPPRMPALNPPPSART